MRHGRPPIGLILWALLTLILPAHAALKSARRSNSGTGLPQETTLELGLERGGRQARLYYLGKHWQAIIPEPVGAMNRLLRFSVSSSKDIESWARREGSLVNLMISRRSRSFFLCTCIEPTFELCSVAGRPSTCGGSAACFEV